MFQDTSGLPLSGTALVACVTYALFAGLVTGPLIGERTAIKAGWYSQCARHIGAEIKATAPTTMPLPKLDCEALFGFFGEEGAAYCRRYGDVFDDNILTQTLDRAQSASRAARENRIANAAANASSRCECALTTTLERRRTSFAIYTGSLRLIAPPAVKALQSELVSSLNSPDCAFGGGAS